MGDRKQEIKPFFANGEIFFLDLLSHRRGIQGSKLDAPGLLIAGTGSSIKLALDLIGGPA